MIIRRLHIENFGHFHDFTLELSPGLNRLRRENEFGKSTIFEFIRRVLWGYPDGRTSQSVNRYPARFNAGEYGGFLEVELKDGSTAVLERYGQNGKLVVRRPDGSEEEGEAFLKRLTPISGNCYRNVYAVTLDELTMLASLEDEELRGRLYGGAITGGNVSLPDLGKQLDLKAKELYKQRRGASRIGAARQELRDACERRDRALNESARRPALEKEIGALEAEISRLRAEAGAAARTVAGIDLLLKAHPRYLKLAETEAALAALPPATDVPEAAARRAEELTARLAEKRKNLPAAPDETQVAMLAAEAALLDRELAENSEDAIPLPDEAALAQAEELARRAAAASTPALPERLLPVGAVAVVLAALTVLYLKFRSMIRAPLPVMAILAVAALGVVLAAFLVRRASRRRRAALAESVRAEAREGWHLVCPPEEFVPTLRKRLRRETLAAGLAELDAARKARAEAAALKCELDEICRRFECADAPHMRRMADLCAKTNELRRRRAESAAALDALLPPEKQSALADFDPEAAKQRRAEAAERRAELEKTVSLLHQKAGAVANELEHLPDGGEVELLDSGVEAAKCSVRQLVRDYLVVRLCRAFLDAAVARYERESQPEVLKHAEKLFSDITAGRYDRLYRKIASGDLAVHDSATDQEKSFSALSRGTREELMLAMRLALVECTERDAEPLPVCFDDVGVNFDPGRLARAEAAVADFARGRQVVWFSHS